MTESLFPDIVDPEPAPAPSKRPPAERRRERHLDAIHRGQHPLSVALGWPIRLHPDARRDGDRTPDGSPRCGDCRFRVAESGRAAKTYVKCHADNGDRRTGGPGTDVAAWWPACTLYAAEESR